MKTERAIIEFKCESVNCSNLIKTNEIYYIKFEPKKDIFYSNDSINAKRIRICKSCASKYHKRKRVNKNIQLNLFKEKFATLNRGVL